MTYALTIYENKSKKSLLLVINISYYFPISRWFSDQVLEL